jgi:hypothetical protein
MQPRSKAEEQTAELRPIAAIPPCQRLRFRSADVHTYQQDVQQLLPKRPILPESASRGRYGPVNQCYSTNFAQALEEIKILHQGDFFESTQVFERRAPDKYSLIPIVEISEFEARKAAIEPEPESIAVKFQRKCAPHNCRVCECSSQGSKGVRMEKGISVQEKQQVADGVARSGVHLESSSAARRKNKSIPPGDLDGVIAAAAIRDNYLDFAVLIPGAENRRGDIRRLVQRRNYH